MLLSDGEHSGVVFQGTRTDTSMTEQTIKDLSQVVDLLDTRQYELAQMLDACPQEVETLATLKAAAQGALEAVGRKA